MPRAKLDRTLLRLSGEGVTAWLDGLITNSLKTELTFAALLTPQGKIIADFFVLKQGETLMLETATKFGADLKKRLKMYKLRAPITIEDLSESHCVYALWDLEDAQGHLDPRLPALGHRWVTQASAPSDLKDESEYNAHRLSLGIPDSRYDFETQTTFPADANMDLINGVDFKKGCFVGQEVVSRMKRMTTVKKRFRGVIFDDPASDVARGDDIKTGDRVIGQILSTHGALGMAMIRLDRWRTATESPTVNGTPVRIMGGPDGSE